MHNGLTDPFAAIIESIRTVNGETIKVDKDGSVADDSQTEKTVQRGAIGAALGAIIGAIAGGGRGAPIGGAVFSVWLSSATEPSLSHFNRLSIDRADTLNDSVV